MSKERNEIVDNITQPSAWIRALFVAVFADGLLFRFTAFGSGVEYRASAVHNHYGQRQCQLKIFFPRAGTVCLAALQVHDLSFRCKAVPIF